MKFSNHAVLKNIDFDIEKGEKVFIIGPSGCGKSTLLRCLNHLIKPTRGDITFEGQDLKKTDINLIRTKLGLVFQSFNLFPHLTVLENIILAPTKLKLMKEEEAKQKALELLDSIKLKDKANFYPDELSGGQKQRVAIIRTLIMEPNLIMFDEPTSALDPKMTKEVTSLIQEVAETGITMLIVSHEMEFVKSLATRVIFMQDGKIIEEGSPNEIFKNPKTKELQEFLNN
ncbi:MAG: amino acid ABC transporter ATP-binding protein [Erysipelotrichaceae bacterium]|nr:amino acid ABC transporter ATP-binding protein [Erysipelotrichaceae bacterium]